MAFDLPIIEGRIAIIETNLTYLAQIPQADFDTFLADFRNPEAAKHLLQTSIEAMIDTCAHLVSRLRLQVPGNGRQLVQALADAGYLPVEHIPIYLRMIRFRNVVVHLYVEVDNREIYNILAHHLDDFRLFIADVWQIVRPDRPAA